MIYSGGKQPAMKDGWYYKENDQGEKVKINQKMVFESGDYQGLPKGLRQVCTERFGEESVEGKKQDQLGMFSHKMSVLTIFVTNIS